MNMYQLDCMTSSCFRERRILNHMEFDFCVQQSWVWNRSSKSSWPLVRGRCSFLSAKEVVGLWEQHVPEKRFGSWLELMELLPWHLQPLCFAAEFPCSEDFQSTWFSLLWLICKAKYDYMHLITHMILHQYRLEIGSPTLWQTSTAVEDLYF